MINAQNEFDTCGVRGEHLFCSIFEYKDLETKIEDNIGLFIDTFPLGGGFLSIDIKQRSIEYGHTRIDNEFYYYLNLHTERLFSVPDPFDLWNCSGRGYTNQLYLLNCATEEIYSCQDFYFVDTCIDENGNIFIIPDSTLECSSSEIGNEYFQNKVILGVYSDPSTLPCMNDSPTQDICNLDCTPCEDETEFKNIDNGLGEESLVLSIKPFNDALLIGGRNLDLNNGTSQEQIIVKLENDELVGFDSFPFEEGEIRDIEIYGNRIFLGGLFNGIIGDSLISNFAIYENGAWSSPGGGVNNAVNDIFIQDGEIYIGGAFVDAGGNEQADYITQFEDGTYRNLGDGPNGEIFTVWQTTNELFAGGQFETVGDSNNIFTGAIARFKDDIWSSLVDTCEVWNVGSTVHSLSYRNNLLYIGSSGNRGCPNDTSSHSISVFNGAEISNVGVGIHGPVYDILWHENELYIVGEFSDSGSGVNNIARFIGTSWAPVLSGLNQPGICLLSNNRNLYIGGGFHNQNGDDRIDGIARIECFSTTSVSEKEILNEVNVFPNPASSYIDVVSEKPISTVNIYNNFGALVNKESIIEDLRISIVSLLDGVYFVDIIFESGERVVKKIIKN